MLIREESPFLHLPVALNPAQAMALDGIRYSIDVVDESFVACRDALILMSGDHSIDRKIWTQAFQCAWSFVDATHRLRSLLEGMRGIKRTPKVRVLLRSLAAAEPLRHGMQHLSREIVSAAAEPKPAWGSLSWMALRPGGSGDGTAYIAAPGSMRPMKAIGQVRNRRGLIDLPVGQIELSHFGATLSLSDTLSSVISWLPSMEVGLSKAFEGYEERAATDALIAVEFTAAPSDLSTDDLA